MFYWQLDGKQIRMGSQKLDVHYKSTVIEAAVFFLSLQVMLLQGISRDRVFWKAY